MAAPITRAARLRQAHALRQVERHEALPGGRLTEYRAWCHCGFGTQWARTESAALGRLDHHREVEA